MAAAKASEPASEKVVPATVVVDPPAPVAPMGFDQSLIRSPDLGLTRIYFAPADCRPPGTVLDQDTANQGVWVSADRLNWRKSNVSGMQTAQRIALGESSVDAVFKRLGIE